jgi:hypothetical protein
MHTVWLILLAVLACGLAIGLYAAAALESSKGKSEAERAPRSAQESGTPPRNGPRRAGAHAFPTPHAMRGLYGNYDPNLDGAFWTVSDAPTSYAQWNGKAVFLRPLISRTFEQHGLVRHILVTNSLDVKDGLVVKQGAGCRTCPSLIGMSVFEKEAAGWTLISRHDFLAADGAWGAPPRVTLLIEANGGIELQFDRPAIDARNPARQYSIVLRERAATAAAAQSAPTR